MSEPVRPYIEAGPTLNRDKEQYPLYISDFSKDQKRVIQEILSQAHTPPRQNDREHTIECYFSSEEDRDNIQALMQKALQAKADPNETWKLTAYHALIKAITEFDPNHPEKSTPHWVIVQECVKPLQAYEEKDTGRWQKCLKDGDRSIRRRIEFLGLLIPHLQTVDLSSIDNIDQVITDVSKKYKERKEGMLERLHDRLTPVVEQLAQLGQWKKGNKRS